MYCYITLSAWIFLCLHQVFCNSGVNPCTPKAKQGAPYTISSSVDAVEEFKWKTYNASGMTTRSRCFISSNGKPMCVDEYPFCHAEVKAMNGIYQMTLTIPTVVGKADDHVIWVWGNGSDVDFKELGRCKMEVNYPCEPPATLGLPYTFKHTVKTMKHFRWRKQEGDIGYSTISTCYQDTNTRRLVCDDRSSIYHAEVQMLDDGSYSLTLTIPNVYEKRDLDSWIWENGDPDSYKELGSCDLTLYYPCPTPAKQGSPYTFTQHVNTLTNFVWSVKNSMTHCHIDEKKQAICEVESTIYDGEVEKEYKSYKLSLNINSVARPRDEGVWSWKEGPEGRLIETGRCDLGVYSYKSVPRCNRRKVYFTGLPSYSVVWSCTISKFYPTPSCLFQYRNVGKDKNYVSVPPKYVTEGTPVSSGNIVYYSKECNISVPLTAALFSPGKYKFKVIMYPTMVGLDQETELSIGTSTESSELDLVLPKVKLQYCPKGHHGVVRFGYIKTGTNVATCSCVLDSIGNPPGWVEWIDSSGNSVGNALWNGRKIKLSSNDPSKNFTCRGVSELGKGDGLVYTPKFRDEIDPPLEQYDYDPPDSFSEEDKKRDEYIIIGGSLLLFFLVVGLLVGRYRYLYSTGKKEGRNESDADQSSVDGKALNKKMNHGFKRNTKIDTTPEPPTTSPPKRFDDDKLDDNKASTNDVMENRYTDLDDLPRHFVDDKLDDNKASTDDVMENTYVELDYIPKPYYEYI